MSSPNLKQGSKFDCHLLDPFNGSFKRGYDEQRSGLALKDYLKGNAEMHVHYVLRGLNFETREFCAVLKLHKSEVNLTTKDYISIFNCLGPNLDLIRNGNGGQKELVFVSDVKVVEETEDIFVPSSNIVERLQLLNLCKCSFADPVLDICFSTVEGCGAVENREAQGGGLSPNPIGVLPLNQGEEQMIERRPGIVQAIPNDQRPSDDIGIDVDLEMKKEFPSLTIRSLVDGIGFTLSTKGGDSRLESVKVFLCPSNLGEVTDWEFSYSLSPYYKEE